MGLVVVSSLDASERRLIGGYNHRAIYHGRTAGITGNVGDAFPRITYVWAVQPNA